MYRRYSLHLLLATVVVLITLGMVILASTSAYATDGMGENYKGLRQQGIWLGLGTVVCVITAMTDYHNLKRFFWPFFAFTCVLLILCYIPGIGQKINGESRWISAKMFGMNWLRFQPSELAKILVITGMAYMFTKFEGEERKFTKGFVLPSIVAAIPVLLVLFEKDLGSAATMFAVVICMMYIAGTHWFYLGSVFATGAAGLAGLVLMIPNRAIRFIALMDLEAYKMDEGLQQWRALLALGSGGLTGLGLGNGREKMFYMPYAHTDFIFPMIGEELGAVFTLGVVFAFVLFTVCGFAISLNAPDRFGTLLGCGVTSLIAIEAALNIGVTTATLPNTGLPLPLVSYGGSSMVCTLICIGILINIYRQGEDPDSPDIYAVKRRKVTPRI